MSFDEELLIEKVVERPWEATIAQAIRVMEGADIEALGFKCRIGNGRFKVELTLTEVGEEYREPPPHGGRSSGLATGPDDASRKDGTSINR